MSIWRQYAEALKKHGPRSALVWAYRERIVDREERQLVDGILRRGDDSARRVLKRLELEVEKLPEPLTGPR